MKKFSLFLVATAFAVAVNAQEGAKTEKAAPAKTEKAAPAKTEKAASAKKEKAAPAKTEAGKMEAAPAKEATPAKK